MGGNRLFLEQRQVCMNENSFLDLGQVEMLSFWEELLGPFAQTEMLWGQRPLD